MTAKGPTELPADPVDVIDTPGCNPSNNRGLRPPLPDSRGSSSICVMVWPNCASSVFTGAATDSTVTDVVTSPTSRLASMRSVVATTRRCAVSVVLRKPFASMVTVYMPVGKSTNR